MFSDDHFSLKKIQSNNLEGKVPLIISVRSIDNDSVYSSTAKQSVDHAIENQAMMKKQLGNVCKQAPLVLPSCSTNTDINNTASDGLRRFQINSCYSCGKTFRSANLLDIHLKIHTATSPFNCELCDNTYVFKSSLMSHLIGDHNTEVLPTTVVNITDSYSSTCKHCGKIFSSQQGLKAHGWNVHKTRPAMHLCHICSKPFQIACLLRVHLERHAGIPKYLCGECGKGFSSNLSLSRHKAVHSDARPYVCVTCKATFKSARNLRTHAVAKSCPGTYSCNICEDNFSKSCRLRKHMTVAHGENSLYPCIQCNKGYASKAGLKNHKEKHHSDRVPSQSLDVKSVCVDQKCLCDVCAKTFATKGRLKLHIKSVHENDNKALCDICGRLFSSKNSRDIHMYTHTGEKPFKCTLCTTSYRSPSLLASHNNVVHKVEKRFGCPYDNCNQRFHRSGHLKGHIYTHTGEKPFKCTVCNRGFAQSNDRKKHLQNVHDIVTGKLQQ